MIAATDIVRLKITLDDIEPAVMRRIEVPLGVRLGWTNSHLWEFRARDVGWGMPDPGWSDGPRDASKATLLAVLEDTGVKSLAYLYDFGDGWEHTIKVERIDAAEAGVLYPRLVEVTGRCPPEDIGGPPGYAELLAAPSHERHDELTELYDADFDPNAVNVGALKRQGATLRSDGPPNPID